MALYLGTRLYYLGERIAKCNIRLYFACGGFVLTNICVQQVDDGLVQIVFPPQGGESPCVAFEGSLKDSIINALEADFKEAVENNLSLVEKDRMVHVCQIQLCTAGGGEYAQR